MPSGLVVVRALLFYGPMHDEGSFIINKSTE